VSSALTPRLHLGSSLLTPALGTCLAIASRDAFGFLTISMASASASAVSQFLSTYATSSMTEFFMWTKKSACPAFYDDLSKHAVAYRELSLLLRQPPGREALQCGSTSQGAFATMQGASRRDRYFGTRGAFRCWQLSSCFDITTHLTTHHSK